MIVSLDSFQETLLTLRKTKLKSIDLETTGLKWYDNDRLFSVIIADAKTSYYFNFNNEPDHLGEKAPEEYTLPREWLASYKELFEDPSCTWFTHNAKFEIGMLAREGLNLAGSVHCTEAMARLLDGRYKKYSLDECIKRMNKKLHIQGAEKLDTVKAYVSKHKLYKEVRIEGKKKPKRESFYHLVPFPIMAEYGCVDGSIGRSLGMYQIGCLDHLINKEKSTGFKDSYILEKKITKITAKMEAHGLPIDIKYIKECNDAYGVQLEGLGKEWKAHTGEDFIDSNKELTKVFRAAGVDTPKTAKGNPSFTDDILKTVDHPIGSILRQIRKANKLRSSYYSSFLYYATSAGKIHCHIKQNGASKTQRMSIIDPALQTIPKRSDEAMGDTNVRRSFIPPKDFCFFMPDYDQMEYKLMLDQSEEMPVIEKILAGLDVHTATAEQMGIESRDAAKTINFMLLYGGGIDKLAAKLGVSRKEAEILYRKYFDKLRKVKAWKKKVMAQATFRGYVKNWAGGVSYTEKRFEYKGPNYDIQGGCAVVVKRAMIDNDDFLELHSLQSFLALQLHDELLFCIHKTELDICPGIVERMQNVYPYKHLKLTVGPAHSWKSWGDKLEGYPILDPTKAYDLETENYFEP